MKYKFNVFLKENDYRGGENFILEIDLSDIEVSTIKRLVKEYKKGYSRGLEPIIGEGSEEICERFYDIIFAHIFFVSFQKCPTIELKPEDENKIWDEEKDIEYLMYEYADDYDFDYEYTIEIPSEFMPKK